MSVQIVLKIPCVSSYYLIELKVYLGYGSIGYKLQVVK